jgi:hypothetical protein
VANLPPPVPRNVKVVMSTTKIRYLQPQPF